MNVITRRIAAATALLAAPALIALGTAGMSHADTSVRYNGPATSAPEHHPAFPHQSQHPQARHPRAPPPPEPPLTPKPLRARMPPHPGPQAFRRGLTIVRRCSSVARYWKNLKMVKPKAIKDVAVRIHAISVRSLARRVRSTASRVDVSSG